MNLRKTKDVNFNKENGITLIALVITIIVLLILAGVSISTLVGDDGIIAKAQEAKIADDISKEKEAISLAIVSARVSNDASTKVNAEKLKEELEGLIADGTIQDYDDPTAEGIDSIMVTGATGKTYIISLEDAILDDDETNVAKRKIASLKVEAATENTQITESGKTITIPEGYKIASDSGDTISEGIVIEDASGNQWVWISCDSNTFARDESWGIETDGEDNSVACKDELTLTNDDVTFSATDTSNGINKEVCAEIVAQINSEKESVAEYGGFYIGRYETGTESGTAVVKQNQTPYASITWATAYSLANGITDTDQVESHLCSSYAWDTAVNFIQSNSTFTSYATDRTNCNENWQDKQVVDSSGNEIKAEGTATRLATGLTTAKCNIYDMGGNVSEYTTELNPGTSETVVLRGGNYTISSTPAGFRSDGNASFSDSKGRLSCHFIPKVALNILLIK